MGTMTTASNTGDREAAENMLEYVGTDKNAAGGLEMGGSRLAWPDLLVIVAYFVFVLTVGLWSSRRSQRDSVSGYFLASRNMHWIPVGTSLFASNVGSGHFIGLAGAGAATGIAVHSIEQASVYALMMQGWLFVPVYMSAGVYTMPEYLRLRFGGQRISVYLSCLALLLYIFTKISVDLYSGALFIQLALNKSSDEWLYISISLLLGVAAVFTILGGLTAVVWTDLVQTILMIVGAFILMGISFHAVGGYNSLVERFPYATASVWALDANNNTCGNPPDDYMTLLRTAEHGKSDYPWTGMTFGVIILAIYYWCTEQVIVQRSLSSKNMIHAKAGCILASYLKFLPLWLMVLPGMAARVLYPDRVGCANPDLCKEICGTTNGCTSSAYVELVLNLLPSGLKGLMLAVMMAALMSSLTSVFNSASTIFTIDLWTLIRKKCLRQKEPSQLTDRELIIVGRVFVIILVVVSVVWVPVIQNTSNTRLFDYMNKILSFLASPICAVYLLAVFWPRTNEPGAFWSLMIGLAMGVIRFIMEFLYVVPPCGSSDPDPRPAFVKAVVGNVHYLHFAIISWVITMVVAVTVSIMTEPIPPECLYRLTYWTRHDTRVRRSLGKEDDLHSVKGESSARVDDGSPSVTADIETKSTEGTSYEPCADEPTDEVPTSDMTLWRRMLKAACCKTKDHTGNYVLPKMQLTKEQQAKEAAEFLNEPSFWKKFVNTNAVISMVLCTFVFFFYS